MSRRDLSADDAASLPGPILYTPYEVAAMTPLEYEGVLAAIKAGVIPAHQIGVRYYVPAWWVNKLLVGDAPVDEVAERHAS
jgi:hypothetical protein